MVEQTGQCVPAILRAVCNKERVVVATNTIALQEQLLRKDIPTLAETIGAWGIDHKAAVKLNPVLVKGRGNYLCQRRLDQSRGRQHVLFEADDQFDSLMKIVLDAPSLICRNWTFEFSYVTPSVGQRWS